jgi:hypothetical protein
MNKKGISTSYKHVVDFILRSSYVGCPRNNQFFFSVRTELTNRNSICFNCFLVCFAKPKNIFLGLFRFDSVFRTCIETTETNRTLSKQTKTNRKNLQKTFSIRGSSKQFFFSRFELKQTETQSLSVVFWFVFLPSQKFFFSVCFSVSDRYRNNRNKQNLWYGELKRLIFKQIFCRFCWSFVCFGCFAILKLPVSILKRNNRNIHLVLESAKTGFGCFDTKQVSEDTLILRLVLSNFKTTGP